MIQIRSGCFETNSSSTHCLVLANQKDWDDFMQGKSVLEMDRLIDGETVFLPIDSVDREEVFAMDHGFFDDPLIGDVVEQTVKTPSGEVVRAISFTYWW